jgi:hypothetical protein
MRSLDSSLFVAGLLLVGACSLVNQPDDVVPAVAGGAGDSTSGGAPPTGGTESTAGAPGDVNGGQGGAPADPGAGAGAGGQPQDDPGPGPAPTTGMLVLGAQDAKKARYLSVVNGRTGKDLLSEQLPVAGIAYDEVAGRHAWFVFTAGSFPAAPTGAADLEVRRFIDLTGKWVVVGRTTALPPPEPDQFVVLNDRLAYLSHRVEGGKAVSALTVLDTSDLGDVKELDTLTAAAGETFVGLTGDRGSDVNADAPGGRLRLMVAGNCATDCDLNARQLFVGDSITAGTSVLLDRFVGTPRFVKSRLEDRLYVALRSTKPSSRVVVRSVSGPDLASPTVFTVNGFVGDDVGGFALAECDDGGVITDVAGKQLIAFHLVSGAQHVVDLGAAGAQVYTEPFGPSVLALDATAAPGLKAFEISKSGTMNIAINPRSVWQPNGTYMPLTGATRRGEAFKCP